MSALANLFLALALVAVYIGRIADMRLRKRLDERRKAYDESQQTLITALETLRDALNSELRAKNELLDVQREHMGQLESCITAQRSTIEVQRKGIAEGENAQRIMAELLNAKGDSIKELTLDNVKLRNQLAGYRQKLGENI